MAAPKSKQKRFIVKKDFEVIYNVGRDDIGEVSQVFLAEQEILGEPQQNDQVRFLAHYRPIESSKTYVTPILIDADNLSTPKPPMRPEQKEYIIEKVYFAVLLTIILYATLKPSSS